MTRVPLTDRKVASSRPLSRLLSRRSRFSGTLASEAMLAKIKSMLIPEYSSLMIGTNASGTGVISSIAPLLDMRSKTAGKCSKKSSRETCFGVTTKVSISDPALGVNRRFRCAQREGSTWTVDSQAIAPECEDFAASSVDYSLRELALLGHDFLHKGDSYFLEQLKHFGPTG